MKTGDWVFCLYTPRRFARSWLWCFEPSNFCHILARIREKPEQQVVFIFTRPRLGAWDIGKGPTRVHQGRNVEGHRHEIYVAMPHCIHAQYSVFKCIQYIYIYIYQYQSESTYISQYQTCCRQCQGDSGWTSTWLAWLFVPRTVWPVWIWMQRPSASCD